MLRKLEEALRAAVEAPFAQLFPDKLHPVEMAAAARSAMDQSRLLAEGSAYAHNRYTIHLSAEDLDRLSRAIPTLERELTEHLGRYAGVQQLVVGPYLQVRVVGPEEETPALSPGQMHVESGFSAPALAYLEIVSGSQRGQQFELHGAATIGRGADCDLRLEEAAISRHHAEVVWEYVLYQVRDLGSANGTFLNGQQVLRAPLNDGDLLELGLVQLRFRAR